MIKITVITVVYNDELIGTAIQSVKEQSYGNIEYLIIDGGSKDNTINIIESYGETVHTLISEPDKGIYDAINKGIKLAKGDVIGILNSDDLFADNKVIERIANLFEDNSLQSVYSDVVFVDRLNISKVVRHYTSKYFRNWMFRFGFQPAHPTFYARREVFELHGLYDLRYKIAGDFEFLLRVLLINKIKVKYVSDVWVKMRIGGVSTSGIKSILKLNSEIIHACKANNLYTNIFMVYSKYLVKWWGFLFKKV